MGPFLSSGREDQQFQFLLKFTRTRFTNSVFLSAGGNTNQEKVLDFTSSGGAAALTMA
jgi:hypothetical protein